MHYEQKPSSVTFPNGDVGRAQAGQYTVGSDGHHRRVMAVRPPYVYLDYPNVPSALAFDWWVGQSRLADLNDHWELDGE